MRNLPGHSTMAITSVAIIATTRAMVIQFRPKNAKLRLPALVAGGGSVSSGTSAPNPERPHAGLPSYRIAPAKF